MWHKCKDGMPKKDGLYFTATKIGAHVFYCVNAYWNDLGDTNILTDYKGESGFVDSDPDWGLFVLDRVDAWQEIEEYKG